VSRHAPAESGRFQTGYRNSDQVFRPQQAQLLHPSTTTFFTTFFVITITFPQLLQLNFTLKPPY
jgi:hypothetical protein